MSRERITLGTVLLLFMGILGIIFGQIREKASSAEVTALQKHVDAEFSDVHADIRALSMQRQAEMIVPPAEARR